MKYLVCQRPGEFVLSEKERPIMRSGEALLKINKVGICGTDLHAYAGNQAFFTYPRILGHELASQIAEIGTNDKGLKVGDKVVVMPYANCTTCVACRNGRTNCCTSLKVLGIHIDGGMQEFISVPVNLLIPAKNLNNDQMAIVEPLAIGAHALRRADIKKGETIVVIGCGPIGIGIMRLAQLAGAKVLALDTNQERLNYARNEISIDHGILAGNDAVNKVAELTHGDMASAVFDATGNKGALETGHEYMSHGGRYILVGLSKGELSFQHPAIHAKETTLLCSRNATLEDFERVIEILGSGQFPVDSFITHSVSYSDMIAHFDSWLDPSNGVIKATVEF